MKGASIFWAISHELAQKNWSDYCFPKSQTIPLTYNIWRVTDCKCWIFQVSCSGLVEPHQRDRSAKVDGYRDRAHLDNIHHPSCARGNSLRHAHHGIQRRPLEDLFAAPHAEHEFHEGELWHTYPMKLIIQCGEKTVCVDTAVYAPNLHM